MAKDYLSKRFYDIQIIYDDEFDVACQYNFIEWPL